MTSIAIFILLALVFIAIVIALLAFFYQRVGGEVGLIRTGLGGRKVSMNGGLLSIPWFHNVTRVNMQTLKLEVLRSGDQALITKDRMRVDIGVEFYVSVEPNADAIDRASQTLGDRTFDPEKLRDLIEGKLVDSLRSVAARMTMDELHENRAEFANEVRNTVGESLARNGLALDSVSLTGLDQTPFSALDENNAFNAVGMRRLAEVIANSKKERAQIDTEAEVAVHRSAMEASRLRLEIDLEEQSAKLAQTRELESLRASQLADIATRKAESEQASNQARIKMELAIRAEDIKREQSIKEAELESEKELRMVEQQTAIAIADSSQAQSKAQAAADLAKADAVAAAESIITARAMAEVRRKKDVAILQAQQESDIAGDNLVSKARAEAHASIENARAILENAKAEAEAAKLRLDTHQQQLMVDAEGQRALNEADNILSDQLIELRRDMARLDALPGIVQEMMKPAEKINSININQLSGLGGSSADGERKAPVNQAVDSILDMAVQLPLMKKLGEELGVNLDKGVAGIVDTADPDSSEK